MHPYEFEITEYGILGYLPTGVKREFATESEYTDAYEAEMDILGREMADWYKGWEDEWDFELGEPEKWGVA